VSGSCSAFFYVNATISDLFKILKNSDSENTDPIDSIGREQIIAIRELRRASLDRSTLENRWHMKCSTLLARPPAENIFFMFKINIRDPDLVFRTIELINTALLGFRKGYRNSKGKLESFYTGTIYTFENTKEEYRRLFFSIFDKIENPDLWPFYVYILTLVCHPFQDGNGRTARALLKMLLAPRLGIHPADLPLAAAFYRQQISAESLIRKFLVDGDWSKIIVDVAGQVENALSDARSCQE
jgi:hypothetical protein